jgi:hypothetical protein
LPNEAALAEVIEAMQPPYVTICSAPGEDVSELRHLIEFATADASTTIH